MTLANTNTNAAAFLQASGLSALKLAAKVADTEINALIRESGNAIHDLLASGDRGGLTLDGRPVEGAHAFSTSVAAAAGFTKSAGASLA